MSDVTRTPTRPATRRAPFAAAAAALVIAVTAPLAGGATTAGPAPTVGTAAEVDGAVRDALRTADTVGVIVRVASGDAALARDLVTSTGGTVDVDLPIVDGFSATLTPAGLERLSALPGVVVSLDGDVAVNLLGGLLGGGGSGGTTDSGSTAPAPVTPADSSFVETIGADQLHRKGITGKGVGIAVIDTGVSEVTDLKGRIRGALDLAADGDHVDRYGHGTFIAGIAAGDGTASQGEHAGVAPGAHIVPVKITGIDGSSDVTHVLAAIQYVVSFKDTYGIRVLNLSLGTNSTQSWKTDPLNYAVERAWDAGIVVVVSGANLGPDPKTIAKPADDPLVITVGAVDAHATSTRTDDTMAAFSSRGPTASGGLLKPDLVAPGVSVVGLRSPGSYVDKSYPQGRVGDAYFRGSGTSFSTAVVSGAAALLLQAHPEWTPDMVKGAMMATAAAGPVGVPTVDGAGSLDVAAATKLRRAPVANVGVGRSDGSGSLDLSRGSVRTTIETSTTLVGGLLNTVTSLLTGERTAQDIVFDRDGYRTEWTKARWYETDWNKARWYKARWYEADYYKARWYATDWG